MTLITVNAVHPRLGPTRILATLACLLFVHVATAQEISPGEFEALKALYRHTDGDNWHNNTNWDTTSVPTSTEVDSWFGVRAGIVGDVVVLLKLPSNNLIGTIPAELGNMMYLAELDLSDNQLSDSIPAELGNLGNINLNLSGNQLSGSIPAELGNLGGIRLDLSDNQLSGSIPPELGNLGGFLGLWYLYMHKNKLTGELPTSLTQIRNLQQFHFGGNDGLCAPLDDAFQTWLAAVTNHSGPDCGGFDGSIADQVYMTGQRITNLLLPAVTGGAGSYTYELSPNLPAGLTFDASTRMLTGTPTEAMMPRLYTYTATDGAGQTVSMTFHIEILSASSAERGELPTVFSLQGNYPNPFQQSTRIVIDLPWRARVSVDVLDVLGRRIHSLPARGMAPGWDRSIDLSGDALPAGKYVYRVLVTSPSRTVARVGQLVRIK